MANHEATGKKAQHGSELAQRTRKAVLNAFDVVEKRGTPISQLLADELEKNPIKIMELASKLIPRELNGNVKHDHDHKHTHEAISETHSWIEGLLGSEQDSETKKPRQN